MDNFRQMTQGEPQGLKRIVFSGAPGSPYTRKMLAVLRYRHIPYRFLVDNALKQGLPTAKPALLPTFYLTNDSGDLQAVTDSTPLIRRFETQFTGRSVVPDQPVLRMLDALLEDYADEWLTKPMYHYRWAFEADIDRASRIVPLPMNIQCNAETHKSLAQMFGTRQVTRRAVVGSNAETASIIEDSYLRLLSILESHFSKYAFLMGGRPGASDFAVYGQLTQLALFDPTPMELTCRLAPRVVAWTQVLDDLSGLEPTESDWLDVFDIPDTLIELLAEVGRTYVPVMLANERASESGQNTVQACVDGQPWVQQTFSYQSKCLSWLRRDANQLSAKERGQWLCLLEGSGCEVLFKELF